MLNFTDGVSIDTSGDLRPLRLKDGWYVVGMGMSIPVSDRAEAEKEIELQKLVTAVCPSIDYIEPDECPSCGADMNVQTHYPDCMVPVFDYLDSLD